MTNRFTLIPILFCLLLPSHSLLASTDFDATRLKLEKAVKQAHRSDADKSRDSNRKPIETLEFFGFRDDMKVLEILPGGGWYTEILAPALAEEGQLYLWFYGDFLSDHLKNKKGFKKAFKTLNFLPFSEDEIEYTGKYHGKYPLAFEEPSFDAPPLDMVLNIRAQHVFTDEAQQNLNKAVFKALKPGGTYAIIDHTRRHMEKEYEENWRRIDPVKVIRDAQQAGFVLESFSDLHYQADDELRYEVGRPSVQGHTDRFTLKFRKPR